MVISRALSLLSIGWLNSCACCQATSPFPPLRVAVSLTVFEPHIAVVVTDSCATTQENCTVSVKKTKQKLHALLSGFTVRNMISYIQLLLEPLKNAKVALKLYLNWLFQGTLFEKLLTAEDSKINLVTLRTQVKNTFVLENGL